MNEDRTAKLYAGQMGIVAVLVNVLIDKGIISQDELRERFEQAHEAASRCSGGPGIAIVLEDMLTYLAPRDRTDERQATCSRTCACHRASCFTGDSPRPAWHQKRCQVH